MDDSAQPCTVQPTPLPDVTRTEAQLLTQSTAVSVNRHILDRVAAAYSPGAVSLNQIGLTSAESTTSSRTVHLAVAVNATSSTASVCVPTSVASGSASLASTEVVPDSDPQVVIEVTGTASKAGAEAPADTVCPDLTMCITAFITANANGSEVDATLDVMREAGPANIAAGGQDTLSVQKDKASNASSGSAAVINITAAAGIETPDTNYQELNGATNSETSSNYATLETDPAINNVAASTQGSADAGRLSAEGCVTPHGTVAAHSEGTAAASSKPSAASPLEGSATSANEGSAASPFEGSVISPIEGCAAASTYSSASASPDAAPKGWRSKLNTAASYAYYLAGAVAGTCEGVNKALRQ